MSDINMVVIGGTLSDAPKQIATKNGKIGVSFKLKMTREYNGREFSCFISCKCFSDAAAVVLSCAQGVQLVVGGSLDVDSWESNGVKRYETVVKVDTATLCQPSAGRSQQQYQQPQQRQQWYGGQQQQAQMPPQYGQQQVQQQPQQPPQPQDDVMPF